MLPVRPVIFIILAATALLLSHIGSAAPAAPGYIGNWLLEGPSEFAYLSFQPGGSCKHVVGNHRGGTLVGVFCSYTTSGNIISITEWWDGSDLRQKLPEPEMLEYIPESDVLRSVREVQPMDFHRTTKTEQEVYDSKRK